MHHSAASPAPHRCTRQPAQYREPCCCSSSWQSGIMLRPASVNLLQRHLFVMLQVAVLGTGTFGTVLRAVDTLVPAGQRRQRKEVAIKLLPRGGTGSQGLCLPSCRVVVPSRTLQPVHNCCCWHVSAGSVPGQRMSLKGAQQLSKTSQVYHFSSLGCHTVQVARPGGTVAPAIGLQ